MRRGHSLLLAACLLLCACSAQELYRSGRTSAEGTARARCDKLPPGAYEDCLARINKR